MFWCILTWYKFLPEIFINVPIKNDIKSISLLKMKALLLKIQFQEDFVLIMSHKYFPF